MEPAPSAPYGTRTVEAAMILHCTFEELSALSAGAERMLSAHGVAEDVCVAAPTEVIADVEALVPRLDGDLTVTTLAEQERLERAVDCMLGHLRHQMNAKILETYVGADDAVNAYFDYANVLNVLDRIQRLGAEMSAMIEVMTGRPPTEVTRERISFPD